jgi:gluconolactonase
VSAPSSLCWWLAVCLAIVSPSCSSGDHGRAAQSSGGAAGSAGTAGNTAAGGASAGGNAGAAASSGASGGTSNGGASSGGAPSGGAPNGGASQGGGAPSTGGDGAGGGSTATGGEGGNSSGTGGAASSQCPAGPFGSPLPGGAMPTRVAGVPPADAFNQNGNAFGIVEGPVWVNGALYVSEIGSGNAPPPSRILKVAGGAVSIVNADAGTNGLAVDSAGQLWGANHKTGAISRISLPDGKVSDVVTGYGGVRFDSPNDLAIRSDGTIYFSDPDYQAPATRPQTKTRLYRVAKGTTTATVIDDTRNEPNGVTLSPAEDMLYVSGSDGVFAYPVMSDGSVGQKTRYGSVGSGDGMAVDCAGNLYVASNTDVVVLGAKGAELGRLNMNGVQSVSNVAFGGPKRTTLYITALGAGQQKGLFQLEVQVPGMPY